MSVYIPCKVTNTLSVLINTGFIYDSNPKSFGADFLKTYICKNIYMIVNHCTVVYRYMNGVLIRLDEVVFSMSCVYEHIYRTILIGWIFGQKQIQDWDVLFDGVAGFRRRDPEPWWELMGRATRWHFHKHPSRARHKFPSHFRIPAPAPWDTVKINISILNLFLAEY